MFISDLLLNRVSGFHTVFFSRRITGGNGEFLGIVLVGVRLAYFRHIYNSLTSMRSLSFLFLRSDGTVLLRYPQVVDDSLTKMPANTPWYGLVEVGGGSFRSPGFFDTQPRLVSVRPLRDYPLVVNVAVSEHAALAPWRNRAMLIGLGTLLAILCSAFLLKSLNTQFRRVVDSEASIKERETRLAEANARVDTALNNMTQGLCMFDTEEHLVVCNERYLKMYHLPPDVVKPGCSLTKILELRKEAGNFSADIDQYLVALRRQLAQGEYVYMITHLDDGRVIALQNQAATGGGWVATHEDITERQRAEARIAHMARHDALTDLANRMLFRERMDEALARLVAQRRGILGLRVRPRSVQGGQRHARPSGRRRPAQGRGAAPARRPCATPTRSDGSAATNSPSCSRSTRTSAQEALALADRLIRTHRRALRDRGPSDRDRDQHRDRARAGGRHRRRRSS